MYIDNVITVHSERCSLFEKFIEARLSQAVGLTLSSSYYKYLGGAFPSSLKKIISAEAVVSAMEYCGIETCSGELVRRFKLILESLTISRAVIVYCFTQLRTGAT